MIEAFVYGFVLAFGLIMPLGMQNIFIFNQGATQRHFYHALPSVFSASICDTTLIVLSVLGVSAAVLEFAWLKNVIFVIGFFFLMSMGWITWRSTTTSVKEGIKPLSAKKQILFAASVSLLNPHAIIDSVGVIGVNALNFDGYEKLIFTAACVFVSWSWFLGLAFAGHIVHRADKKGSWLIVINKISAIIIWAAGLYIGWQLVRSLKF
ncbi:MAG: amino acid transporter [Proteobacteria bacterium]|nr:amino acid transporter [Pseudomonadota bacterium]